MCNPGRAKLGAVAVGRMSASASSVANPGAGTTRSPMAKPVTPSPMAATSPAASAPRMKGKGSSGTIVPARI